MNFVLYISYLVLIFVVLKFYQNIQSSNTNILVSALMIVVGIYIINLLLPANSVENFTNQFKNK
jgi:cyanate permease